MLPVQNLVGSFLIGGALNLILFGISGLQYSEYARMSRKDHYLYRVAAAVVFVLGVFQSCCAIHSNWVYAVDATVDRTLFASSPVSFSLDPLTSALIATAVQASYCHRVWILSKRSPYLPSAIVLMTAVQLGFGIYVSYAAIKSPTWEAIARMKWAVGTWLIALAVGDVLITASITYYLRRARSAHAFEETNDLLSRITVLTVQNNGLTAVCAICSAALFLADVTWHLVFGLILGRLYICSFYSALNTRRHIADELNSARVAPRTDPYAATANASGLGFTPSPSRAPSFRPNFLCSHSGGIAHHKDHQRRTEESLSVQVVVESTMTEERGPATDFWDPEKVAEEEGSRTGSPITIGEIGSSHDSAVDLRVAPFLAVPPSGRH